ncbi:MAG: hypothetical protein RMY29_012950 [Nostoc sp. CreGUA01]|nr:hypothetical protein [Nostoc sp. CreGUA01]
MIWQTSFEKRSVKPLYLALSHQSGKHLDRTRIILLRQQTAKHHL